MTHPATELAYRTASTAGPFVDSLSTDMREIAYALRHGDVCVALEAFEASTERLGRFLTFVVVSSELLGDENPPLGAVVADYGRRLLQVVHRVQETLEDNDVIGLTNALEHGLADGLAEYHDYEADVCRCLAA
jgi:hypothetical protein